MDRHSPHRCRPHVKPGHAVACIVTVALRRAGPDDAVAIASILQQAFAPLRSQYTAQAFAATVPPADTLRARLAEGPTWLALLDGKGVGTVSAVAHGPDLYLRSMAVLPAARGRGLGRLLLGEAEAFARAQRLGRLTLSTTPFLHAAIALYEAVGFVRSGEGPTDLHGTPLVRMAKGLR